MNTFEKIILYGILLLLGLNLGIMLGSYLANSQPLGGVRGGKQTGVVYGGGESISIASTSPMYDVVIYRDTARMSTTTPGSPATSTIMMYASSTPGACMIMEDLDSAGYTYCDYNDGIQTCSSTNICNN